MSKTVISVENVSKYYRLGLIGGGTLREDVNRWMAKLQGKPDPLLKIGETDHGNRKGDQIWALKDLNFEVKEGDILGIVGGNGAGKSTLLKILSRITAPTTGQITIRGRVGSLLEVGTGFHPELTGRENIYLNGTILGMSRQEVNCKLDEIVEFAEMGKFIDTPVKRYSSGMTVRLAFAVAAHLEPEILVVDEVLAVGDVKFQKKCLGKMKDISGEGRTVLFVTHNMGSALELCNRGLVLSAGEIQLDAGIDDAVKLYLAGGNRRTLNLTHKNFTGQLAQQVRISTIKVNNIAAQEQILVDPFDDIVIEFSGLSEMDLDDLELFINLLSKGTTILTAFDSPPGTPIKKGKFFSKVIVPGKTLRPGNYSVAMGGQRKGGFQWFHGSHICEITVLESWSEDFPARASGVVNLHTPGSRSQ